MSEVVDAAIHRLRDQGQRVTVARRAVIEALAGYDGHPNVDQLYAVIEVKTVDIHRATVYRTLDTLADLGVVSHVHLGHGAVVYQLTAAGSHNGGHLHARCDRCHTIIDLPPQLMEPIQTRLQQDWGFALDAHHVALSGTCRGCGAGFDATP